MLSVTALLQFVNVLLAGIVAGGMLLVLVAVIPTRWQFPAEQAVQLHDQTSRRIDRYMPISVAGSAVAAVLTLALRSTQLSAAAVALTATGLAASVLIAVMSLVLLMPTNKQVAMWARTSVPSDYAVVMHRWGRFHAGRTACAVLGLVVYLLAALSA